MGCGFSTTCPEKKPLACDVYRGSFVRLLGYGTHVGTACSAILPPSMQTVPSVITTAYVSSDIFNRAVQSSAAGDSRPQVFIKTLDALIWHSLATFLIPGFILNKVKEFTVQSTKMPSCPCTPPPPLARTLPMGLVRALPCIASVLAMPLIVYPIDKAVTLLMDYTYRAALIKSDDEEIAKVPKKAKVKVQKKASS